MLDTQQIQNFKDRLEKERAELEQTLQGLGARNPSNPSDWVPAAPKGEEVGADRNENADIIEAMHDNNASMNELEGRLNTVLMALKKIEDDAFGVCEVSGEEIELERLEANPAARTCKAHMETAL